MVSQAAELQIFWKKNLKKTKQKRLCLYKAFFIVKYYVAN